ncbi:MAG: UbiA family prenyltransferase [Candidatus Kariarchaeaceae archaeon]
MAQFLSLSKPRIIILLLITGIVGYIVPDVSSVKLIDLLIFIIAGYLSSGGAMMVNSYIDRDIDHLMARTRHRTLIIENASFHSSFILMFGAIMSLLGIVLGWLYFNSVVGIFLAWGVLFYIFGYTLYLKRKNILNTIFGGLASPAPVWAGYAARLSDTSNLTDLPIEGWMLGFLVFIWTPSHTWALSTKYVEDYRNASIPMLPVQYGIETTAKVVFYWGIGVILFGSLTAFFITNSMVLQLILVIPHIMLFSGLWAFYTSPSITTATKCFKFHNMWLGMIFLLLVIS